MFWKISMFTELINLHGWIFSPVVLDFQDRHIEHLVTLTLHIFTISPFLTSRHVLHHLQEKHSFYNTHTLRKKNIKVI